MRMYAQANGNIAAVCSEAPCWSHHAIPEKHAVGYVQAHRPQLLPLHLGQQWQGRPLKQHPVRQRQPASDRQANNPLHYTSSKLPRPHRCKHRQQHTTCWAQSANQQNAASEASVPPSAKLQNLFSPLVPVLRKNKHDNDIKQLAIPALFSLLLDPVMSLIDCAIIGRLGSDSLAATGASISIFSLAGLLVSFLSYVTVPAVAQAATSGDDAEVSRVISTGVWLAVLAGLFVTGFIMFVGPMILGTMGLEAGVVAKAKGYVWARALGSIGHLLVLVGAGSFRGIQVCAIISFLNPKFKLCL